MRSWLGLSVPLGKSPGSSVLGVPKLSYRGGWLEPAVYGWAGRWDGDSGMLPSAPAHHTLLFHLLLPPSP